MSDHFDEIHRIRVIANIDTPLSRGIRELCDLQDEYLVALPEHIWDFPPSLNLHLGKKIKWNSHRARSPNRPLSPPRWKVWEVVCDLPNNNLDLVLHDIAII